MLGETWLHRQLGPPGLIPTERVAQATDMLDRLGRADGGRLTLQETFQGCARPQRLGLFLATLELVRLRRIDVRQQDLLAEIVIELRAEE